MPDDETIDSSTAGSADDSPVAGTSPQSDPAISFPPANFSTVVSIFSTQAMVAMGAIPNPATGKPDIQIDLARHLIDLIDVLEKKSKGNLDQAETSMIDATLHHLRVSFIEQTQAQKS